MNEQQGARPPNITLVGQMSVKLVASMKSKKLWRCHVLIPDCRKTPYAQVARPSTGIPNFVGLFCLEHAVMFAEREGFSVPRPEHN